MKQLLIFSFLSFLSVNVFAISAYPYRIAQTVNGETVYIRLFGDEHCKWAEAEDGYTIVRNSQGQWAYAFLDADSVLTASPWTIDKKSLPEAKRFLETMPKHLQGVVRRQGSKRTLSGSSLAGTGRGQATNTGVKAAVGQRRMLIILMSFRDLPFSKTTSDFDKLFNEENYHEDGAQGSVRDFYLAASYRQLELESDIYGPYAAANNMSYYGKNSGRNNGNDVNVYTLFEEAITHVAADTDLSIYDGDGDGYIDNVHIIFAGHGEEAGASADAIWSHEATFYRPYTIEGLKIDRYSCAPELRGANGSGISRIGPHCHEIGHALGAMDFYDTDYSTGGEYAGTGKWDIMASGSWNNDGVTPADFNPYVKAYNYGWIKPKVLPAGEVTLQPSNTDAESYYILKRDEYSDYYLLENRSRAGWGAGLPGQGLLVFHVHADIANAGNDINATAPQMCYVVCASSKSRLPGNSAASYGDINSGGCPFPGTAGKTAFGQSTTPQAFYWDGTECAIDIKQITMDSQGLITLQNNSSGASHESKEWRSLVFESFEESERATYRQSASSEWTIEENPENTMTIINKPVAYEGVRSLQLSGLALRRDVQDTLEFYCTPAPTGTVRMTVCASSLHKRFNKHNTVTVGYRTADSPDWTYTTIESKENNRWRQTVVELPDRVDGTLRLIGKAFAGSILAIDNITVEQETVPTPAAVSVVACATAAPVTIYDVTGQRRTALRRGLNIINNGLTTKKIIR